MGSPFKTIYFPWKTLPGELSSCQDVRQKDRLPAVDDGEVVTNWGLVVEGFASAQRVIQADLEQSNLQPIWFEVLLRLVRTPGHRLPMTQLAEEVSFSSGGFTKLADRIAEAGYVERVGCPGDRRVTWMTLTPTGEAVINAALEQHVACLRATVLGVLGEGALAKLGGSMRKLRDHHR
jgi:DNA-binding MarR family transcriptional regulator